MTERISPDELLQRYVHEIGALLPSKDRTDVMDELQSLLSETIEERSQAPRSPGITAFPGCRTVASIWKVVLP